jgi:hypothetical protein
MPSGLTRWVETAPAGGKKHYCDGDCSAQFDWQVRWTELQFSKQVVLPVELRIGA